MGETNKRSNNPCGIWDDDGSADVFPGSAARPRTSEPFSAILERAVDRRGLLKGAAFGATLVIAQAVLLEREGLKAEDKPVAADPRRRLRFRTVPPGNGPEVMVPPNYRVHVVLAWGDPLFPGLRCAGFRLIKPDFPGTGTVVRLQCGPGPLVSATEVDIGRGLHHTLPAGRSQHGTRQVPIRPSRKSPASEPWWS